jgi:hypothetical protein
VAGTMTRNKPSPAEDPLSRKAPYRVEAAGDGGEHVKSNQFLISALGASAGGLEPLKKVFMHMPADADIAFVIVQHLAPDHASALAELLRPLRTHAEELSRLARGMVGRELRMIEMKEEVNELCHRLGEVVRYPLEFEQERERKALTRRNRGINHEYL